jgi:hypothetical protein
VELASLLLIRGPNALRAAIDELKIYLAEKQLDSLDQIVGASVREAREYAELVPLVAPRRPWQDEA